jgi:hypothetical protein
MWEFEGERGVMHNKHNKCTICLYENIHRLIEFAKMCLKAFCVTLKYAFLYFFNISKPGAVSKFYFYHSNVLSLCFTNL